MSDEYPRYAGATRVGAAPQAARSGGWSTEQRLVLAAVGIPLALTAVGILVAVALMFGLRQNASHLTDSQIQYATAVNAAALTAKAIANDERGFLLSGELREADQGARFAREFIRQLDDRTIRARAAFAVAASEADSRDQRRAVREANQGFEEWIAALHEETAIYEAGNRDRAIEISLTSTRQIRKEYEKSLAHAQDLGVDAIQSGRSEVSDSATRSLEIVLGYLVAALAVGLAVAAWIASRLRRRPDEPSQRVANGGRLRRIA
jgi:methyl-accepting chemotaxis protein